MFLVTIFVSSVGGIRAVFTTDAFFGLVMFIGQIGILIHSFLRIENLSLAISNFTTAYTNQTDDVFNISPYEKFGFWDLTIGVCFMCCYLYGANHAGVLRILSARSDKTAKFALIINAVGLRQRSKIVERSKATILFHLRTVSKRDSFHWTCIWFHCENPLWLTSRRD